MYFENTVNLMEKVVSKENMTKAYKQVKSNKGSAGIDNVTVEEVLEDLFEKWDTIKTKLLDGTYEPSAVKRVEIPKPNGGVRLLGIPTVMDRIIQQAISQILTEIYEPTFSENSYGFRPNRSAKDAVIKSKQYVEEGYKVVVDIDLEKFFDKVNHDKLMYRLWKNIEDKNLLRIINKYLKCGVIVNGLFTKTEEGAPQGGPLSPLLSNIVLDELDKELEKRGLHFVRYADDCNVYVKTVKAGNRVMESITKFIEGKLKLKVNKTKSAVDYPRRRKFLGFTVTKMFGKVMVLISDKSMKRFKDKIRDITNRNKAYSIEYRIKKLKEIVVGWVNYYGIANCKKKLETLDEWIRRRLRACIWKQWKRIKTKHNNLVKLGINNSKAWEFANTRKGYWRISNSPILGTTLTNKYFENIGYVSLSKQYSKIYSI